MLQERDLTRIDLSSGSDVKKAKVHTRLEALRRYVLEVQRQKQTVNEYLYSNNESVGRIQGEVNAACRLETGGTYMCACPVLACVCLYKCVFASWQVETTT